MISFFTFDKFKRNLFLLIFTSSIFMAIASTGWQLFFEYQNQVKEVQANLQFVSDSYLSTISDRLWDFDERNVRLQLQGILKLPGIQYCAINGLEDTIGSLIEEGDPQSPRDLTKDYKLFFKDQPIGTLTIAANFDHIFDGLMRMSIFILASRGLEIFIVATIILLIINQVLFRHFTTISSYARHLDINHLDQPLTLQRPIKQDELQLVVAAINDMRLRIQKDITKQALAEKSLIESHERFLKILNSIDATVYVADMETHEILFMNQHMIESFGRDMTGEICWEAFRGKTGPCTHCTNDQLIDENGKPNNDVCVWKDKNPITGKLYVNHDRAIEWTDGRFVRMQIATDITDFTKIEEQLRQAQKMESIGRLAGGVAHDFNNMLSIILGNTEMVLEELDSTNPVISCLHEIHKATERSASLTRQLLAFARKQTISPQVLDLNQTVEGMLKMLRPLIGENIDLAWLPRKKLWPINIDPSQIDQILANLCVNARDSIHDVGKIIIETDNVNFDQDYCHEHGGYLPGDYVMTAVSDNGCGMDREIQDKLFEPFFTTKGVGEGTGLGLATVYGIVKQNNGFINVYSEPNKGTTFRIYFPRHAEKDLPKQKPEPKGVDATGCETILLVEDEKAILKMTTMMLERLGYTVLAASDPAVAVDIGKSHTNKIDLLMTDVVMPGMNGKDLARKIAQLFPNLKILFMSGYTANLIAHHGVLDRGVEFIQKPFSRQDLAQKIRDVLNGSKERA